MKKLVVLILIILPGFLYAQSGKKSEDNQNALESSGIIKRNLKNNIYANGSFGLLYASWSINYERMILRVGKSGTSSIYLRSAFGKWEAWGGAGSGGILSINLVISERPSHLEAGLGCILLYEPEIFYNNLPPDERNPDVESDVHFVPNINVGYRYQHPSKHFFLRFGFAFPEGAYTGIGVHF